MKDNFYRKSVNIRNLEMQETGNYLGISEGKMLKGCIPVRKSGYDKGRTCRNNSKASKNDLDLNFSLQLDQKDLETLVAAIRVRIDQAGR